jgi:hypothetical protein
LLAGVAGVIYKHLQTMIDYPMSMYWSESWRIYAASLVFSPLIYGESYPWPWLDPARAIVDGVALVFPTRSIAGFRGWIAFLILSTHFLAAQVILRRAGNPARGMTPVLLSLWGMLFLYQGPIYYHLLLGAILTIALIDPQRPGRTCLVIACASAWMGLSRVNWFMIPATLAILFYILQTPRETKSVRQYLQWPALFGLVGGSASLMAYGLHIRLNGYIVPFFHPEMNYGFFRFKLFPNEAYPMGLLAGIALASLPLLALIAIYSLRNLRAVHGLRWITIAAILFVYFSGSTYVSLRAGGGFDLHNYDTFLLLLFITGVFLGMDAIAYDRPTRSGVSPETTMAWLRQPAILLGLSLIPVGIALASISPIKAYSSANAEATINVIQQHIVETQNHSEQPILLIDARHLLVFDRIQLEQLTLPYEKIELMEMAMAGNKPYLERFREEIDRQNFALIVSEVLVEAQREVTQPMGYENNVWNIFVTQPILRSYEAVFIDRQTGIGIYRPRGQN